MNDEIWNSDVNEYPSSFIDAKHDYDKTHWFGWEHDEDPRFESAEPNRGRTSTPKKQKTVNEVCSLKYDINKNNFEQNTTEGNAEWFSPENIKMLPLIKL